MKATGKRFLKTFVFIQISITLLLWIIYFSKYHIWSFENGHLFLYNLTSNVVIFTKVVLLTFAIIISLKAKQEKGILLFALTLIMVSQNNAILFIGTPLFLTFFPIHSILSGIIFIWAMQHFPKSITKQNVESIYSRKNPLRGFIKWNLRSYSFIVIAGVLITLAILGPRIHYNSDINDVFLMIIALANLYVNFKTATKEGRNKILWIFWGAIMYTLFTVLSIIIEAYHADINLSFYYILSILQSVCVIISFTMSLFFYNSFDTGILIQRTVVDSVLFLAIILLYNTFEHYMLHWMSYKLHLSNTMVSSFFSGIIALSVSPLHHKLMHFLEIKVKKDGNHSL